MRNNIIHLLLIALFSSAATTLLAQDIEREVTVEKEYSPEVDAAVKRTGVPVTENPLVEKPVSNFSSWAVPLMGKPSSQPLLVSELGTQETFENQKGYANFGMGNNLNINGDAGIRIINTKKNQLGVWYNHTSTGGNLKYKDNVPVYGGDEVYQNINSNTVNLTYKHVFKKLEWSTSGAYKHNTFNYYGAKLTPNLIVNGEDDYQQVNQYAFGTTFRSIRDGHVSVSASIGFVGYYNREGYIIGSEGGRENHIQTNFEMAARLNNWNNRLGFEFNMDNLIYNHAAASNYTVISVTPFYKFANDNIRFKAGAKVDISVNDGTLFRFAPDVEFNADMGKYFQFYTTVVGGKEVNTWSKMSGKNIYINPTARIANTYTPVDATMGLICNVMDGLSVRAYGGFKASNNALFDMRYTETIENNMITSYEVVDYMPIDAYRWLGGASVNFKLKKIFEGEVKWVHNSWRGRNNNKLILSALPKNEWNIRAVINPMKDLSLNANFYMGLGRGYRYQDAATSMLIVDKMGDIYDLNIGASYLLNDMISFNLQWNNILSQHYDIYYGMPAQRMHFLIGAGVKF